MSQLKSGHLLERFITPMDEFVCVICREVCRDTCVLECGHIFCQICIIQASKTVQDCPSCRKCYTNIQTSPWHRIKINGSHVHCINHGCLFIDALERIETHEKDCEFRPSPCSVCNDMVPYKDTDTHSDVCKKRPAECQYCMTILPFDEIDYHIKEICTIVLLACPNQCVTEEPVPVMLRDELTLHRKTCLFEPIPCTYSSIGCTAILKRCEIEEHKNDFSIHFPLLYRSEKDQRKKLEKEIEERTNQFKKHLDDHRSTLKRLESILPKGPEKIADHEHPLELCMDLSGHRCDHCGITFESSEKSIGYRCGVTCDYDLCTACFSEKRIIKSTVILRRDAMYRLVNPNINPSNYAEQHPLLLPNELVNYLHPYVVGSMVKRGPMWRWGNQDGEGLGKIIAVTEPDGWLTVLWISTGITNNYRAGFNEEYDLVYA